MTLESAKKNLEARGFRVQVFSSGKEAAAYLDAAVDGTAVEQLRKERGLEETPTWQVNYYPDSGQVGLVEFLMDSETTAAMAAPPPKDQAGETGDAE